MPESRLSLTTRVIVGVVLLLEAAVLLFFGMFASIIGGLVGALALGVGGGSATNEQMAKAGVMFALTLASPFVAAGLLGTSGTLMLLELGRRVVIAVGCFALAAQGAYHAFYPNSFHPAEVVPCIAHVMTVVVGVAFMRAPAKRAASPAQ